jgi:nitrogen fixation NifU-like protein
VAATEPQFDDLYRETLIEHYRAPRNQGRLDAATHHAEGLNPVCGDEVRVDVRLDGNRVAEIRFEGEGCSISQATASMMSVEVLDRPIAHAGEVQRAFEAMLTAGAKPSAILGDLEALQGVSQFPVRIKCALLPWKVLAETFASPISGGPNA